MTHLLSPLTSESPLVLAQIPGVDQLISNVGTDFGSSLLNVLKAIIILIVGWIISGIVKSIIKRVLSATDIDNRIAAWVTGQRGGESLPIEEWISNLFCWLIRLFVIVACLDTLNLEVVSAPLNSLLDQVTSFIPQIVGAGILLGIAWVVATLAKTLVTRGLGAFNIDEKLEAATGDGTDFSLGDTLGNVLYWFVFLLFLPAILSTLELDGTLTPIQGMMNKILGSLPHILEALIIGAVFWLVAKIVSRIVTGLLSATGIDGIGERMGLSASAGRPTLSSLIGTIVLVTILVPGIISALEKLQIEAISEPATDMLNEVFGLLPNLFSAAVVLVIFYILGQFVSDLVANFLAGVGFNDVFEWLGIASPEPQATTEPDLTDEPTLLPEETPTTKTPSEFAGLILFVAIMLFAIKEALSLLGNDALEEIVGVIIALAGQVVIAGIFFAIGLFFAQWVYKLIIASGTNQANLLAQAARAIIIIFVGAMSLSRVGVAPDIVNLAFGLLLGAVAVAIALAFGLGGRDVAKEQLRSWVNSIKEK
ncbi:MAG: mechanosensitive ion channel [Cyanobacteria bacterium P01_F01_bin.143]